MARIAKMNISKLSDEQIEDMFTEAFQDQVASLNNIGEFECKCNRAVDAGHVVMEVMVAGLAGTPTYEEAHGDTLEELEVMTISREDKGELDFERSPEDDYVLNTNDYIIVYRSV